MPIKKKYLPKAFLAIFVLIVWPAIPGLAATQQQSGSVGIEGTVPGTAPTQAATIGLPKDGQVFSNLPITVSGFCPSGTLVEIYSNNVFVGSAVCQNGSYSLQIDLFDGRNDLIARVYDNLDQAGPDSATVTVTYSSGIATSVIPRVTLTTQYAKRGANPGTILSWPITLSGGSGPYAITVDWGDKTNPDLFSQQIPGDITIQHTYAQAGIYSVIVKASDANGNTAFLQLIGVGNGKIQQSTAGNTGAGQGQQGQSRILWWPITSLFILIPVTFWLGKKHQLEAIRRRLRKGEQPFS